MKTVSVDKAKGCPIPDTIETPYIVVVLGIWRDAMRNLDHSSKQFVFTGKDREDVYSYIKYYSLKFGWCDAHNLGEGWAGEELKAPDMTDPEVAKNITKVEHNEEAKKSTKASGTRKKATRKKSRKKR